MFPKVIDLTDFFRLWMFWHRFDVRNMLHVLELNVKNPAFAKRKTAQKLIAIKLHCTTIIRCKGSLYDGLRLIWTLLKTSVMVSDTY